MFCNIQYNKYIQINHWKLLLAEFWGTWTKTGAGQWCSGFSLTVSRVRVAAAESMPLLLECARVRGPEYLTQMWLFMCDALIKAIGTEPDSDVLSEIMHSFAKVKKLMPFLVIFFFFYFQESHVPANVAERRQSC